jgi:hypothetical protein
MQSLIKELKIGEIWVIIKETLKNKIMLLNKKKEK